MVRRTTEGVKDGNDYQCDAHDEQGVLRCILTGLLPPESFESTQHEEHLDLRGRGLTCFLEGTSRKLSAFQLAAQGDGVADLVGSMGCRSLRPKFCLIVGRLNYSRDAVTESARFGKRPLQVNCVPIETYITALWEFHDRCSLATARRS
jgi:hypothetical protein